MRMLLNVKIPNATFNAAVKDGTVGPKLERILAEIKPEAVYFTEMDGSRGVILVVEVANPAHVPALAEPWFLTFNADVQLRIVMSPADLKASGVGEMGKKWA
jgi:hypothetical protein